MKPEKKKLYLPTDIKCPVYPSDYICPEILQAKTDALIKWMKENDISLEELLGKKMIPEAKICPYHRSLLCKSGNTNTLCCVPDSEAGQKYQFETQIRTFSQLSDIPPLEKPNIVEEYHQMIGQQPQPMKKKRTRSKSNEEPYVHSSLLKKIVLPEQKIRRNEEPFVDPSLLKEIRLPILPAEKKLRLQRVLQKNKVNPETYQRALQEGNLQAPRSREEELYQMQQAIEESKRLAEEPMLFAQNALREWNQEEVYRQNWKNRRLQKK